MPLELQIREFPDECVFLNKEYCVKIFAMDSKKTLHTHPVPLQLAMFYANGVEIEPGTIADVSPIEMSDESKMCATVKITFKKPSVLFKNEKVYFVVRPAVSSDGLDVVRLSALACCVVVVLHWGSALHSGAFRHHPSVPC